jgi:Sec-independent protein secretion pathway component TatC
MKRKTALMFLFIATVIWIVGAVVGLLPALMTPMMFDAPGSLENSATVTLAISIATFPVVCIVAVLLSWLVFALPLLAHLPHRYVWACALTALPLINVSTGGLALAWLLYFNDGSFT